MFCTITTSQAFPAELGKTPPSRWPPTAGWVISLNISWWKAVSVRLSFHQYTQINQQQSFLLSEEMVFWIHYWTNCFNLEVLPITMISVCIGFVFVSEIVVIFNNFQIFNELILKVYIFYNKWQQQSDFL